jgi:hypothetical protein
MNLSLVLLIAATVAVANAQQPASITIEELASRIAKSESAMADRLKSIKPIMEVYAQHTDPHPTLGSVPNRDEYFLGQFEWTDRDGPSMKRLTPQKNASQKMAEWFSARSQLNGEAFAAMPIPDWRMLSAANHQFTLLRREFLGEVRCLVLDVSPKDEKRGFTGRIWVDDRDFAIVRFNGVTKGHPNAGRKDVFNVDSWRTNVAPGIWVPSYVYAERETVEELRTIRLKAQIRFWGYDLKNPNRSQEFTTIQIGDGAMDAAGAPQQLSPTESHRLWEKQAEENVLDRLTKAGLLAPPSEVDKILETVVRNLQITNDLPVDPPIRARVLLTSPLESFTVGRTIVMSRGLIDVLPDEATLAMMLAHELAHITIGQRVINTQFAFADKLMVPDDELLATVRVPVNPSEEIVADPRVIELLKNSPYKEKLADSGVFVRAINDNAIKLRNLVQSHVGTYVGRESFQKKMNEQFPKPAAEPAVDQTTALQLGGRIMMNPWTSEVELLRAAAVAPTSAREKNTLAVSPLIPYLRYAGSRNQTQDK